MSNKELEDIIDELFGRGRNLWRNFSVGWDPFLTRIQENLSGNPTVNYPPHDIIKIDDWNNIIRVAVAGFTKSDLKIKLISDDSLTLIVNGHKPKSDGGTGHRVRRGIAGRDFKLSFSLIKGTEVKSMKLENGILELHLTRDEDKVGGITNVPID